MDILMPELDGLEATKKIRENPENKNVKIIALTGNSSEKEKATCIQAGMNNFISKRFNIHDLTKILTSA